MRCDVASGDKTWTFYIPWHFAEQSIPACEDVFATHFLNLNGVVEPITQARK